MWDAGAVDDVTWGALALALTVAGGLWTWWAFGHRGPVSGVRGIALTLLPAAAWLTGTLELAGDVASAVSRWSTRIVLSPGFWLGVALAGTSALLLLVTGFIGSRTPKADRAVEGGGRDQLGAPAPKAASGRKGKSRKADPSAGGAPAGGADDEFADIEAMLRRRGIE